MAARQAGKKLAAAGSKVVHGPMMRTHIRAGLASAAPPLGSMLGQRGLNVAQFCSEFNRLTEPYVKGVPVPTVVHIRPDRSYTIELKTPHIWWLVSRAAGVRRGCTTNGEVIGKLTVKHIYEIAKVKQQAPKDKAYIGVPLERMCRLIITYCHRVGIQVVHRLDRDEHLEFMRERRDIVQQQLQEIHDAKAAKMLRIA